MPRRFHCIRALPGITGNESCSNEDFLSVAAPRPPPALVHRHRGFRANGRFGPVDVVRIPRHGTMGADHMAAGGSAYVRSDDADDHGSPQGHAWGSERSLAALAIPG